MSELAKKISEIVFAFLVGAFCLSFIIAVWTGESVDFLGLPVGPNGVPPGAVVAFLTKCPNGWEPADASNDRINLTQRFIMGADSSQRSKYRLGANGGSYQYRSGAYFSKNTGSASDWGIVGVDQIWFDPDGSATQSESPRAADREIKDGPSPQWYYGKLAEHYPPYVALNYCVKRGASVAQIKNAAVHFICAKLDIKDC